MFFDKFAGDHQTESGAAMSFGAEKRSKQLFQNLFIHAGAVVADLKFYDITRFLGCFKPDLPGFIRVFIKQAGIHRIGCQIQQNFMNDAAIHDHFTDGIVGFNYDFNSILAGFSFNQLVNVINYFIR